MRHTDQKGSAAGQFPALSGAHDHPRPHAAPRLRPLTHGVLLALLGSSPLAMAIPLGCTFTGTNSAFGSNCTGIAGTSGTGNPGLAGASGNSFDYTLTGSVHITGGAGGSGTTSLIAAGGGGGAGGAGVSGSGFTLNNGGTILGGAGGAGGLGSELGMDGPGGAGGAGVSGSGFTLRNTGQITGGAGGTGSSTGSGGVGVLSTGNATVYNSGSISGGSGANAITFGGGGNTLVIEQGSSITGNVIAGGTDTLALGGDVDAASAFSLSGIGGQYQGFGHFEKQGASLWTLDSHAEGATDWTVKAGTLRLADYTGGAGATTVTGAVTVQNGATLQLGNQSVISGTLSNHGTVQVGYNGSSASIAHVNAYTQGSDGVFRIAAHSNDSEGGYGQLRVTGSASLAGKAFVDVASVNTLAVGQTLSNVLTAGTLSGNFSQVDDNSAMFDFRSVATAGASGHVDFEIVKTLTVTQAATNTHNTPGQGAARVLDQIIDQGSNDAGMQRVITGLGQQSSEQALSNAVSQTLPLLVGSSQVAANSALSGINGALQDRNAQARGASSGDESLGEREMWVKPFASRADQDMRNGVAGFRADTAGLLLGGDAAVNPQLRVGLAFGYAKSNIDGKSTVAPNSADIDLYQLIGYGSYELSADNQLAFQLDYGQSRTDGRRSILFMNTVARSNYDSQVAHAGVAWNHDYPLGSQTLWSSNLGVDYTWIRDAGYQESGAGALNLNVAARTTESLVFGLGGKLTHDLNERIKLSVKLGVGYDAINDQAVITSTYSGAPGQSFVTRGLSPSPWLAKAGLGVVYKLGDRSELSVNYAAERREDFLNQSASLKARWLF